MPLAKRICAFLLIGVLFTGLFSFGGSGSAFAQTTPTGALDAAYNVAHDAPVQVTSYEPAVSFHDVEQKLYPGPSAGVTANSETWTGFLRQGGRRLVVTLPETATLTGFSLQCLENTDEGILFPTSVEVELSMNGQDWYNAGTIASSYPAWYSGKLLQTYALKIPRVQARYVQVVFPVDVWVLARNLRVLGSPFISPSLAELPAAKPVDLNRGYLPDNAYNANNVHNMLLVYIGAHGHDGTWTAKDFAPMVSYMSPSGQIEGTMFNSFLFLPYGSELNSVAGWQAYLSSLFAPNEQLAALNQTVATQSPTLIKLGDHVHKVNVVISIPYPKPSITNFGYVSYFGRSLDFNSQQAGIYPAYSDRLDAITWFMKTFMQRWKAANYAYLNLSGFYWDDEEVQYSIPDESLLIHATSQLVGNEYLPLFWIPEFDAPGLISWKQLGFNTVIVQSNYFGTPTLSIKRVNEAAAQAFRYGLGTEIEVGEPALTSTLEQNRYFNELVADYQDGVEGKSVHAYYDGSKVLLRAYQSDNSGAENLYLYTHLFILGQFTYDSYLPTTGATD
jgi:hypothetical protein